MTDPQEWSLHGDTGSRPIRTRRRRLCPECGLVGLKAQEQDPAARELSFSERFGLFVDQHWNWRENQALRRRLKNAELRVNACIEEIDYRAARGLDESVIRSSKQESAWVTGSPEIFN